MFDDSSLHDPSCGQPERSERSQRRDPQAVRKLVDAFLAERPELTSVVYSNLRLLLTEGANQEVSGRLFKAPPINLEKEASAEDAANAQLETVNLLTLEIAAENLSPDEIRSVIEDVKHSVDQSGLVKYLSQENITGPDLKAQLEVFCHPRIQGETISPAQMQQVKRRLADILLTGDPDLLPIVQNKLTIQDYLDVALSTITTDNSIGRVGGKAAGLILADRILASAKESEPHPDHYPIKHLLTNFISANDVFDAVLRKNGLEHLCDYKHEDIEAIMDSQEELDKAFANLEFPPEIEQKLAGFVMAIGDKPVAIRSSSLQEDSVKHPFAGKYETVVVVLKGSLKERISELTKAISKVYRSTFNSDPMAYRKKNSSLMREDERMGILLQEVVGKQFGKYFFPTFAGVGLSFNDQVVNTQQVPEDGSLSVVMGLGAAAVDRSFDNKRAVSLTTPREMPGSFKDFVDACQRKVCVFDVEKNEMVMKSIWDLREEVQLDDSFSSVLSAVDFENERFGALSPSNRSCAITCKTLLYDNKFISKIKWVLRTLEEEIEEKIDIEFASDGESMYLLQSRPQVVYPESGPITFPSQVHDNDTIFTAGHKLIPTVNLSNVEMIVHVRPGEYAKLAGNLNDVRKVVKAVQLINNRLPEKSFILMGPGRWGTGWDDVALGVPSGFVEISNTALLVEIIDLSKGTGRFQVPSMGEHFGNDLRIKNIHPLALYPNKNGSVLNESFLLDSSNSFAEIVPELEEMSDVIRVINLKKVTGGTLSLASDRMKRECIGFIER